MALGLLLSAFVANPDRAASIVPIVLIPQIIFSGTLIKVAELPVAGKVLSWFVAGNWGVQAVGQASGVGAVVNAASQLEAAQNNGVAKDPFYIGVVAEHPHPARDGRRLARHHRLGAPAQGCGAATGELRPHAVVPEPRIA